MPHGEEYVLHEEVHVEANGTLTHRDQGDPYIGEPYVGSLPLECIEKCVADPSCHGACCLLLGKRVGEEGALFISCNSTSPHAALTIAGATRRLRDR